MCWGWVDAEEVVWREGRGTVATVRKLGAGRGSGISKAYSQPPNWDLIFVESGGKLCRENQISSIYTGDASRLIQCYGTHLHMGTHKIVLKNL